MSVVKYMIGMALTMQANMDAMQEEWKERILKQWEETKKMPRKMKKKKRKELILEWSIACYDPFNGYRI